MSWLLLKKLAGSRITWGVGIALGVLLGIAWHGHNKYAEGKHDGITQEKATWVSEVALARASATASQVAADAATSALRDSLGQARAATARAEERAAMQQGKYREALGWYLAAKNARVDSLPLTAEQLACDSLASSCANAIAASQEVRDSLTAQLRTAEALSRQQDSVIRMEPARTTLTVREAMAAQRDAFKAPSRSKWFAGGFAAGAAAGRASCEVGR